MLKLNIGFDIAIETLDVVFDKFIMDPKNISLDSKKLRAWQDATALYVLTRSTYSPVRVSIRISSPS